MANILWINDLSGSINQGVARDLLANKEAEILINVSQAEAGNWRHRNGTSLFLDLVAGAAPVKGLHQYEKPSGSYYLHMAEAGNLRVSNEVGGSWDSQEASVWAAGSTVEMTNFIGKHYMIGSATDETLRYATETGNTTLVNIASGTADAASTGTTLVATTSIFTEKMVGHTVFNTTDSTNAQITAYTSATQVTVDTTIGDTWDTDAIEVGINGTYLATNDAYLLVLDPAQRKGFWSNVASDTFTIERDYFNLSFKPTGCVSFGNGRPFLIFSEDTFTVGDPATLYTDEKDGYGCVSHRSIAAAKGYVIWLSREGFNMMGTNDAYPVDISAIIRNDATGEALINKIATGNYTATAAGIYRDRYFCALKDLSGTLKGETLNDCVVEIDLRQSSWKLHTYTDGGIGSIYASFIDTDGDKGLYAGSNDTKAVYKMEVDNVYTDDNSSDVANAVTSTIKTKFYEFGTSGAQAIMQKLVYKLHFKYRATSAITVSYALDGSDTYTPMPATLAAYTTNSYRWQYMDLGKECKSISLKFETTGDFTIYGFGIEVVEVNEEDLEGE